MRTREFAGTPVGAVGLGCMGMSWAYSESERDDDMSVALIREALDLGVTFLDTAQPYGDGHNETLLGRALVGRRDEAVVATKTGLVVADLATRELARRGTPEHVKASAEDSLRRLRTDVIDLYYLHRVDPEVPLADTWGAMAELVAEGKVRGLGLSEVSVAQAARAHAIHPVAAVQSELSLWTRDALGAPGGVAGRLPGDDPAAAEGAGDVVAWCAANGAAFVPFSPLGRGFLTGTFTAADFEDTDFRGGSPRFQEEALRANLRIVDVVRGVAERHGATPAQVAIAWTLAQGDHVLPIPGTKKSRYLRDNAGAAELDLTPDDLIELDGIPAAVGERY
ncbi:aryl-alcohol dehydrogenase-like predicted oxidoreductase [Actinomadura pelletieri DSM 43383]|uniref:Aryl-alcohol dehydrogenase-like predicted oxidoreductase n=1 Tax=Actinomadura pelletieri DSM 43383 TaxID=1120940 RepID=A0A495QMQ6_9ACTN|nr:aldo/keto reductase [Actinomadura pelletieri]RKS74263.1 aryl-alcohol dehydrogenase-like predicted oxidoreductase [Actinomadura pelletieri DSM 43383]